jgi:hypothetical protein
MSGSCRPNGALNLADPTRAKVAKKPFSLKADYTLIVERRERLHTAITTSTV